MTIKAFDTDIVFEETITRDGQPIDLTNCTIKFQMKSNVGGPLFSDDATPDADQSTNKGVVRYWPGTNFPTSVGSYNQDWFCTTTDTPSSSSSSSGPWTFCFPEASYNPVRIIENLNNGVTS